MGADGLVAGAGAVSLLLLTALFFGPTKIIPILFALGTLFITIVRPDVLRVD